MILIALGANLPSHHGTPRQTIFKSLEHLKTRGVEVLSCSPIFLTAPVPISDQPWYHNAVALVKTDLGPHELLSALHETEAAFGRVRSVRNEARVLDLDLLDYHGQVIDDAALTLPHPRMHLRSFVLLPLYKIAPNWKHPILHTGVRDMLRALPQSELSVTSIRLSHSPELMGILNVTPDSFSDGGAHLNAAEAVEKARSMIAAGASVIDIGGESTRPGAIPISAEEECARILPVVEALQGCGAWLSVDTYHAETMAAALKSGVQIINDITAMEDPKSRAILADSDAHIVLMHMQNTPQTMQNAPHYEDVVREVYEFFEQRMSLCAASGIDTDRLILDVGIGFGKTTGHNLKLLRNLGRFKNLGARMMLGASRKRFIADILGRDVAPQQRLGGSIACAALAAREGINLLRVHDIPETRQFLELIYHL